MSNFENLDPGNIALIQRTPEGRILQIGITKEQSEILQIFLASLSKESPLVQMGEDYDLALKSKLCKKCKTQ